MAICKELDADGELVRRDAMKPPDVVFTQLICGHDFTCGIALGVTDTNPLYCWGRNFPQASLTDPVAEDDDGSYLYCPDSRIRYVYINVLL